MSADNWDWNKLLRMVEYADIVLDRETEVHAVFMECTKGQNDSRKIAIDWDDISEGWFYYRDWTKSGLPFVDAGDIYWSMFSFENLHDAEEFLSLYGGVGNWLDGYQEYVNHCNQKRNNQ